MRQPNQPACRNLPACAGAAGGRLCRSAQTGPRCTLYTIDGIKPYHRVWRSSSAGRRWQAEQPAAAVYFPRPKALGACLALAKPHLHCPKTAPVRSTRYWLQGPDSAEGADLVTGTGGSLLHASVL